METKAPLEVAVQEVELLEEVEVVGDHLHPDQGLEPQPPGRQDHNMTNDQWENSPWCSQETQKWPSNSLTNWRDISY